jgi:hypothetical protein
MIQQIATATPLLATVAVIVFVALTLGELYRRRGGTEQRAEAAGKSAGETLGRAVSFVAGMYLTLLGSFIKGILKFTPGRGSIGDSLIVAGHKLQLRKHDAIVNVIYGDGVVKPQPATWESEQKAFHTTNDEWFSAEGIGFNPKRLNGKVPVVWALRDSNEVTEPLEAVIARARKLGRFLPYEQPSGDPDVAVDIDPNNYNRGEGAAGRQAARADGGNAGPKLDGTVVSFREGYEMFGSKVSQEKMKDAEKRGKLAALQVSNMGDNWKYILAIIGAFALGLFGPALAGQIAGGAGGAVSGGLPELGGIGLWLLPPGVV